MPSVVVHRYSAPSKTFVLRDETGTVVNLTGATLKFAAKRAFNDPDSQKLFDVTATVVDGPNGKYRLDFTRNATSFPPATYVAELRQWNSGVATTNPANRTELSNYVVEDAVVVTET